MRTAALSMIALAASLFSGPVTAHDDIRNANVPADHGGITVSPKTTGGPDAYGYTFRDSAEGIAFDFIDISPDGTGTGTQVLTNGASFETSAPITLGAPFPLYGELVTQLTMNSAGFLTTDLVDHFPSNDQTNDCPLPATPSVGGGARIYALHDALVVTGGGYHEFFPVSPIPGHDPGQIAQPATVFMWNDATHLNGGGETWDFEVILFHMTGEIFMTFGSGNPETGSGSTTGLQNEDASIGLTYACNTVNSIPDFLSIVFELDPGALNVPFFRDSPTVPGFIGVKNVSALDLTVQLVYTQSEDQGGGNFQPVNQPLQTFQIPPNAAISWRPVQDDVAEGSGQAVPNTSTTDGSMPAAGSVQMNWMRGGPNAIQGRYVELGTIDGFSYLLPPAIGSVAATVNVPFFRDTPTVPGFIGLKNTTATDLTLTIVYTQVEDVGGGVFEPVDQAPQTFVFPANSAISWRPVQDDAAEGLGQGIPNTSTTDGSTPSAGSARISWAQGGNTAIQGRYVESTGVPSFSYLLPQAQ